MQLSAIKVGPRHRKELGDVAALAESINGVGLLHPVVVKPDGTLIAGARRLAAVKLLKWTDVSATVVKTLDDAHKALLAERDENTCRKDFAPSEAVAVGKSLEELEKPKAEERAEQGRRAGGHARHGRSVQSLPQAKAGKTRAKVAAAVGMSHTTYEKAKAVVKAAEEEPEKFAPLLADMDRTGKVDKAYRRVNAKRIADAPAKPLPTGTYDLILADPPWKYDASETETRHLDNQYPTLDDNEIASKYRPPAAADAVLFLWATAPKLKEALAVMEAWGFAYRTHAIWDKEKIGMGYWFRGQHELLLVGTKGRFSPPAPESRVSSVIRSARGRHSRKPEEVYGLLEAMFPKATKLEMFARETRAGWESWGKEAA